MRSAPSCSTANAALPNRRSPTIRPASVHGDLFLSPACPCSSRHGADHVRRGPALRIECRKGDAEFAQGIEFLDALLSLIVQFIHEFVVRQSYFVARLVTTSHTRRSSTDGAPSLRSGLI